MEADLPEWRLWEERPGRLGLAAPIVLLEQLLQGARAVCPSPAVAPSREARGGPVLPVPGSGTGDSSTATHLSCSEGCQLHQ